MDIQKKNSFQSIDSEAIVFIFLSDVFQTLSERRDSNPRPRPWQGRALPTELLSQLRVQIYMHFL